MNIKELYIEFSKINIGDIGLNKIEELKSSLEQISPHELSSIDEHKQFLLLLKKLREYSIKADELKGKNFLETLKKILSVGEDGLYSNRLRFLYELIQNVDDCDYEFTNKCLKIKFDDNYGHIVFEYNEIGFMPRNVFAITGIAEESKNINPDKIEIGEKGIGFKTVFGIAESVHIESGYFSFELYKNNFTIPEPRYENFSHTIGTRLTLKMNPTTVKEIYREIVEKYRDKNVLLSKNPILFLNKLTSVQFYVDSFRNLEFNVTRSTSLNCGDYYFETDIDISIKIKDYYNGRDTSIEKTTKCYRYIMPIKYNREACVSRYSKDTKFDVKNHSLIAVIPKFESITDIERTGTLYSFLPTQIKLNVPLLLHVPYKLDASREFVDSEGSNIWFEYSNSKLNEFIKKFFVHLASILKENIIHYLPNSNQYIFKADNEKIKCLELEKLHGEILKDEKLFYGSNGTFESSNNVVSFEANEQLKDLEIIYLLLGIEKSLFLPPKKQNMAMFGVEIITEPLEKLVSKAFSDENVTEDALKYISEIEGFDFKKYIGKINNLTISQKQLSIISSFKEIFGSINQLGIEKIKDGKQPQIRVFVQNKREFPVNIKNIIVEALASTDLNENVTKYLNSINNNFIIYDNIQDFLICKDMLILPVIDTIKAFAEFYESFDKNRTFTSALKIRSDSEKLNTADTDNNLSNRDYFLLLKDVRQSIKSAYGSAYNKYIQIINQSGINEYGFIKELLQNADDCEFSPNIKPDFRLTFSKNLLTIDYNEKGFEKKHVRAITAIGESTKNLLQSGKNDKIGEKGIGFKSVFKVANNVSIYSGDFQFKLTADNPTIPLNTTKMTVSNGTKMIFDLKQAFPEDFFSIEKALNLSLCLRRLQHLELNGINIDIKDSESERIISINDQSFKFEKFEYKFTVDNSVAINSREHGNRKIDKNQQITFYIPKKSLENHYLYCGLPTHIEINIPMIIDAPFELTTSREDVFESPWNALVRDEIYYGIIEYLHSIKSKKRIDILKYLPPPSNDLFVSKYLSDFDFQEVLCSEEILPVWESEEFVSSENYRCILLPDIYYFILSSIQDTTEETYVDIYGKQKYDDKLKWLGCEFKPISEIMQFLLKNIDKFINDSNFRDLIYRFLYSQKDFIKRSEYQFLNEMKIIPVKTESNINDFKSFSEVNNNIFKDVDTPLSNEYFLLNEEIMTSDTFLNIFNSEIRVLDNDQKEGRYLRQIEKKINSMTESEYETTALFLLNEFQNNRNLLDCCRYMLKDKSSDIPMKLLNGKYWVGNKYLCEDKTAFMGEVLPFLIVSSEFDDFAKYLDFSSVFKICYDDINYEIDSLSSDDIEDFWYNPFKNRVEIITNFIREGKISDELIGKYDFQGLICGSATGIDEDSEEEFPEKPVQNIFLLEKHIKAAWENPNRYIIREVMRQERVPERSIEKDIYVRNEYNNFCQMCKKKFEGKYIEFYAVELEPKYAWEQMHLSLCLKCSKDYKLLRNNSQIHNDFLKYLMSVDIYDTEPIKVPIGNSEMNFTATHIVEIQQILKLQREEHAIL